MPNVVRVQLSFWISTHWQIDDSAQNLPTSDNQPELQYDTLKKKEDVTSEQSPELDTKISIPDSEREEPTSEVS